MKRREQVMGSLAVLLAASFYGVMSPIVKGAYGEGHTFPQITFSQFFYATLFYLPFFLWRMGKVKIPIREGVWLFFVGVIGLGGTSLFYYASLQYLPASISLILLFQFVWIGLLMDRLFFKKKGSPLQLFSVLIVLLGTFFAVPLSYEGGGIYLPGFLLGLAAAVSYSFFLIGTSHISHHMEGWFRSAWMVIGAMTVIGLIFLTYVPLQELNPFGGMTKWGLLLGLLGQVFPPLLFSYGAPKIGGSLTSLLGSMELPVGLLAAFFLLKEEINLVQWMGILLIFSGILLTQLEQFINGKGQGRIPYRRKTHGENG
ncbi:conserved membrane hypothetical protein [[Clostridium] ultunense Esp]|uniref:DMT family transporter n=1 Tax=Thermicanus aegyptius TaxID=94009 RepID=UPI0002B6F0FB|nr:DMT family transporter [Thermicanus aegyptius]CCQ92892.1 conserved membrane hypothetical protein [[Clostridium] ultunense Esp]